MTGEAITRPEFSNALEGIRRELQSMNEHFGSDLAQIRGQLQSLIDVHHREGREVGELAVRVKHAEEDLAALHEAKRQDRNNRWGMYVAVGVALLGHLLTYMRGAK